MFDALPEAFGSFRVVEAGGPGRFGPLYRAQDQAGLSVAIKVFDQGLTDDQAAALAATLEKLRDAPLNHPGIVPVLAAGVVEERVWLAEPWFDAETLDVIMAQDEPVPPGDVVVRVTQVAAALDFAAAVGIFHGALHPRDILVTANQMVLTGIGVIQALSDAGLAVPMEGAYVSPQRAAGAAVSAADDIFSLAAIGFELVLGVPVPPLSELRTVTTPPRGIDVNRFLDVTEGALAREPRDRPLTALRLAAAIQETVIPIPIRNSDSQVPIAIPIQDPPSEIPVRDSDFDSEIPIRDPKPAPAIPAPRADSTREVPIRPSEPAAALPADLPLRGAALERNEHRESKANQNLESKSESDPEVGIWFPLTATLAIGLLMGFAGGYVAGQRDATPAPHAAERPVVRQDSSADPQRPGETAAPTAGRDFTESVVPAPLGSDRAPGPPRDPDAARPNGAPSVRPGVLQVDSRPRGARVFIDGRLVGTTPVVVSDVPPGAHAVRIDLRGHRRWVTSVDVGPGERHRVAASLER